MGDIILCKCTYVAIVVLVKQHFRGDIEEILVGIVAGIDGHLRIVESDVVETHGERRIEFRVLGGGEDSNTPFGILECILVSRNGLNLERMGGVGLQVVPCHLLLRSGHHVPVVENDIVAGCSCNFGLESGY